MLPGYVDRLIYYPMLYLIIYNAFLTHRSRGADQGQGQNRSRGPLLQQTSPSDRKATETNQMHSSDLEACGKKCHYFWFHS